jgi:hypothetical protein
MHMFMYVLKGAQAWDFIGPVFVPKFKLVWVGDWERTFTKNLKFKVGAVYFTY